MSSLEEARALFATPPEVVDKVVEKPREPSSRTSVMKEIVAKFRFDASRFTIDTRQAAAQIKHFGDAMRLAPAMVGPSVTKAFADASKFERQMNAVAAAMKTKGTR